MAGRSTPFASAPFRWPEITWSLAACREISPCHSHVMQVAPQAHLPHVHKFSSAPPLPPPLPSLLSLSVCVCKLLLYYDCAYAIAVSVSALALLGCTRAATAPASAPAVPYAVAGCAGLASWASLCMDLGAYVTRPKQ